MLRRSSFGDARYGIAGSTFENIVVHPTIDLLRDGGPLFRGGPDWPLFHLQIAPRQCWFGLPVPVDRRPPAAAPVDTMEEGVWCGPISVHFGHMIADFGMRIAASSWAFPELPLVFSIWSVAGAAPLPAFYEVLTHLGIAAERVRLVDRPTRVRRLHVLPQAERPYGGGPSRRHLDLMDAICDLAPEHDLPLVFVSRAGLPSGRFAGERVLEEAFAAAGAVVLRPETVPLKAQLDTYRRARRLIFSEGSALHALQLLGRLDTEIIVLGRRPWRRLAAASLRPRVRSLRYLHALRGLVYGLRASGAPQRPAGISILDEAMLLAELRQLDIDLAGCWDQAAYERAREEDVVAWIARRLAHATHPGERAAIESRLRALSIRV